MQRAIFALVLLGLAAQATAAVTDCNNAFNADINNGGASVACFALSKLNRCILDLLATSYDATTAQTAQDLIIASWMQYAEACSPGTADDFPATIASQGGNIVLQVGSTGDVGTTQYSRSTMKLSDVSAMIDSQNAGLATASTTWASSVSGIIVASQSTLPESTVTSKGSAAVAPVQSTVTSYANSITTTLGNFRSVLTNIATAAVNGQTSMAIEENNLSSWMFASLTQAATQRLNLNLGLADDASDTVSVNGEDQALLGTASTSISLALQQFVAMESSRGAARLIAATADAATLSNGIKADLSVGLALEVNRTASRATVFKAGVIARVAQQTGTTDYGSCTVDGAMYFSKSAQRPVICQFNNRNLNTPLLYGNRGFKSAGSNIILAANGAFEQALLRTLGLYGSTWAKCYDAVAQGFSSTTFHNNCNNQGATVTLALSNTGRIFGGWTDQAWKSRNTYWYAGNSIIFRSNPTTNVFESAYYASSAVYNYAIWDHVSYCPTFGYTGGGGYDWLSVNPCQTPNFSAAYFTNPSYSSTWLSGSTAVTLTRLEVFYRVI